ncbi:MAG: tetratricopeptide repeat protein [Rikenellaceae bacterium]
MKRVELKPTPDQTFEIISGGNPNANFTKIIADSKELQQNGDVEAACNLRFGAVQTLHELLPDDDEVILEWKHANSRSAIELLHLSAIDHFLINDFEISSALLELSLDLDPEDHLEVSELLAYDYLAMGEYELFDEVINDISDKYASRALLILWSSFLRDGAIPSGEMTAFRSRFSAFHAEFVGDSHQIDKEYMADIESEKPTLKAQARELWLKTENLWTLYPQFIEALKRL